MGVTVCVMRGKVKNLHDPNLNILMCYIMKTFLKAMIMTRFAGCLNLNDISYIFQKTFEVVQTYCVSTNILLVTICLVWAM